MKELTHTQKAYYVAQENEQFGKIGVDAIRRKDKLFLTIKGIEVEVSIRQIKEWSKLYDRIFEDWQKYSHKSAEVYDRKGKLRESTDIMMRFM